MNKKKKIFLLIILMSIFITCVVERFMYPNVSFDITRGLIVFGFMILFLCFCFFIISRDTRMTIYDFSDKLFSLFKLFSFKKVLSLNFLKIIFSVSVTLYVSLFLNNVYYFVFGLCEVLLITLLSNLIISKKKKLGMFLNDLFMFLYNLNVVVLMLGGSFISFIMLSNVDSLEDLQGKTFVYVIWVILTLVFSFIPIKKINIGKKKNSLYVIGFFVYEICMIILLGVVYSPLCNYGVLASDSISFWRIQHYINNMVYKNNIFYKSDVNGYINYNNEVGQRPNIILIFTEGLSKHIIYDQRNIMPNVNKFSSKSIDFSNYYNHTAATYRGLIGQLYSGYQMDNLDENHLISLHGILSLHGYNTYFLNTEPNNSEFTNYLKSMKFDKVITGNVINGVADSISDRNAYDLLFDSALELNKKNKPFFFGIYTFGTHISCDSIDEKFGDGNDNVLNKFYDVDYQFGKFIDKFNKSELFDNTIVIFTTDHASYTDYDYLRAFSKFYEREFSFLDEIPLYIYHKNVEPRIINVSGRNSLDLAPTILDYIDISAANYFLGKSLFSDDGGTKYDTIFTEGVRYLSSKNEKLEQINFENDVVYEISGYLSFAKK